MSHERKQIPKNQSIISDFLCVINNAYNLKRRRIGSFGFEPLITRRSEKRSVTYQSANYRRSVSKSTPVCNCHNEDDIVAARQLSDENVAATDDYKYGSFHEARCNCRLSCIVDCGVYRVSVCPEPRGAA